MCERTQLELLHYGPLGGLFVRDFDMGDHTHNPTTSGPMGLPILFSSARMQIYLFIFKWKMRPSINLFFKQVACGERRKTGV